MRSEVRKYYQRGEKLIVRTANNKFNALSDATKKRLVLVFAIVTAFISIATMTRTFNSTSLDHSQRGSIQFPKTETPMKDNQLSKELIPLGKMKGEVDGEFDSFYVAIDKNARLFINRDIKYNEHAYDKTDAWKEISMDDLKRYERDLHFIPLSKSKGLKP